MTFVTRQETTWGDLRDGETIVDKNGDKWFVEKNAPLGSEAHVAIIGDKGRAHVIVKPASDPVTVIRDAPAEDVQKFYDSDPELGRAKATVEDSLGPVVEILPVIDTPLELRSHLYLLHGFMVHEATNRVALLEHHKKQHALEAEGKPEKGYTPHEHKEES